MTPPADPQAPQPQQQSADPRAADAHQLLHRCAQLASCTEHPGQTTRLYLCPAMRDVHALLTPWMTAAGLTVTLDAAGNLRGRYPARVPDAPTLLLGSHLDTVPNAGAFDGIAGVLLALAAIEHLHHRPLPFAIELLAFAEEEGVRFGIPFLGSLALTGGLTPALLARTDQNGISVREALQSFGGRPDDLLSAQLSPTARYLGFLELHIEQGPVLDQLGLPLGIVTAIAGQTRARLTFRGTPNHAGTTPMPLRHDALAAAAAFISAAEHEARTTPGLVATVGHLHVLPNASNIIPGEVLCTLDLRHPDDPTRTAAFTRLSHAAHQAATSRGVTLTLDLTLTQPAVPMDPTLSSHLATAATAAGHPPHPMPSGAGHDAMVLAPHLPSAMLFLRSPGGLSHHPDEALELPEILAALHTLDHLFQHLEATTHA